MHGFRNQFGDKSANFSVYLGNFPHVVRDALALRVDPAGKQVWNELPPKTDTICTSVIDLIWKPVNFVKREGFDLMYKRCLAHENRPFVYNHFENISCLSTKPGLIRTLSEYYTKTDMFRKAGYNIQHSMAMSFIIPVSDCLASR